MNWKTLITFVYPLEAQMAKGFLDSQGIETIIKDELTAQINNFYSTAIGGVKLLVREADFEKGIEVLKKGHFIKEEYSESADKIEDINIDTVLTIDKCPFCGSDNFRKNRVANYWIILPLFLLGALFPIFRKSHICFDCGKKWRFLK